jgi:hypothetical protein
LFDYIGKKIGKLNFFLPNKRKLNRHLFDTTELQKAFEQELEAATNGQTLSSEALDGIVKRVITGFKTDFSEELFSNLEKRTPSMVTEYRKLENGFTKRNQRRWNEGFSSLRSLIVASGEFAEATRNDITQDAHWQASFKLNALSTIHARCLRIANEIICLMENGYADAALARWRTLHELAVVSTFIFKNDEAIAERYIYSKFCKSYKAARNFNKHHERANLSPFSDEEIRIMEVHDANVRKKYGDELKYDWGWAHGPLKAKRPNFTQVEEFCELDHWQPRVAWSNQEIHGGFVPAENGLGQSEAKDAGFLIGQSNSGMSDPGQMTAISLLLATSNILLLEPNIDRILFQQTLSKISDEMGVKFQIGSERTKH